MFGRGIHLFTLFGFKVSLDLSWLILAVLVTWSLAAGLFPMWFEGFSTATYWWMGLAGALGLFFSIVFHEMSHSLVARRYGMSMKGITLFIFGGVAEMTEEPTTPRGEFFMAVVGPISSVVIGLACYGVYLGGQAANWPEPVNGVLIYLAVLNWILAGFNLVPAFPLDGGRILRSILWAAKRNLRWATRISSQIGSGFGIFLIVMGVLFFISGNFIGGVWWFLIGMFVRSAAQMSYRQLLVRKAFEGEEVRRFMKADPVTVSPDITTKDLVENYFYRHHYKMFPVTRDGHLVGCVNSSQIRQVPREEWSEHRVDELAESCLEENTIPPDADAVQALSKMNQTGKSRLMVVEGDRLVGVIALKDMLRFLSIKMDLEGEGERLGRDEEE